MTTLSKRKTRLVVETDDCVRERGKLRQVVLEPQPYYMAVRLKGTRTRMEISYAAIYDAAAKLAARKAREDKLAARKAKRAS